MGYSFAPLGLQRSPLMPKAGAAGFIPWPLRGIQQIMPETGESDLGVLSGSFYIVLEMERRVVFKENSVKFWAGAADHNLRT